MKTYRYTPSSSVLAFGWVWILVAAVFYLLETVASAPVMLAGIAAAVASLTGYVCIRFIPPRLGEILGLIGWILLPLSFLCHT